MASEITVKTELKEDECLATLQSQLLSKMNEACVLVQDDAKKNCPVDTGRLQGSITYATETVGKAGVDGVVGTNVEYAPYVEAGTSKMQARPFLENAMSSNQNKIQQLFQGLI